MRHAAREGFLLPAADLRRDILVPRYYDPRIPKRLEALRLTHDLRSIDELVAEAKLSHYQGKYIPKIYYGTGPYPYIRTSDLVNCEVKASPKHGVPEAVYNIYAPKQDVRPEDVLFVHEGTYLIGTVAMVTAFDGPMLYQHHLDKFRVLSGAPFGPYFLLAALETNIVQSQIRARQFSADIIDSVVGRVGEVVLPIPYDQAAIQRTENSVREMVLGRAEIRERLSYIFRELDGYLRQVTGRTIDEICRWRPSPHEYEGKPAFLGGRRSFSAFIEPAADIVHDILIPKYYDPQVAKVAKEYEETCDLVTVEELVRQNVVTMDTGDEIGKINYGRGNIPFVRTSDLGNWELKRSPKQGVGEDVYAEWGPRQDVQPGDIILVRDGTYLVGTSIMVTEADLPLLYCGGMIKIKIRSVDPRIHPVLLLTLLNLPFVRRQMRNKQFTRDVIDTLGRRLGEVALPVPRDDGLRREIGGRVGELLQTRTRLRLLLSNTITDLYPESHQPVYLALRNSDGIA